MRVCVQHVDIDGQQLWSKVDSFVKQRGGGQRGWGWRQALNGGEGEFLLIFAHGGSGGVLNPHTLHPPHTSLFSVCVFYVPVFVGEYTQHAPRGQLMLLRLTVLFASICGDVSVDDVCFFTVS